MAIRSPSEVDLWIYENVELSEDSKCPICFDIYKNPLQIQCGHRICDECIKKVTECPLCKNDIQTYYDDKAFLREIKGIDVMCPNCDLCLSVIDLQEHVSECEGVEEICKYGCTYDLNRGNIKDHYKNHKKENKDKCPICNNSVDNEINSDMDDRGKNNDDVNSSDVYNYEVDHAVNYDHDSDYESQRPLKICFAIIIIIIISLLLIGIGFKLS